MRRCLSTWNGWWENVGPAPSDPTLGLTHAFLADPSPNKINLGVVSAACPIFKIRDLLFYRNQFPDP